jgi:hypothetical protein
MGDSFIRVVCKLFSQAVGRLSQQAWHCPVHTPLMIREFWWSCGGLRHRIQITRHQGVRCGLVKNAKIGIPDESFRSCFEVQRMS